MARQGIAITALNDSIPFVGFMATDAFLLLARRAPDSMGARMVIVPFDQLAALKITDVVKASVFESNGFVGTLGQL